MSQSTQEQYPDKDVSQHKNPDDHNQQRVLCRGNKYSNYGMLPAMPEKMAWCLQESFAEKVFISDYSARLQLENDLQFGASTLLAHVSKERHSFLGIKKLRFNIQPDETCEFKISTRLRRRRKSDALKTFVPSDRLAYHFLNALEELEEQVNRWDGFNELFESEQIERDDFPLGRGLFDGLDKQERLQFAKEFIATNVKRVLAIFGRAMQDNENYRKVAISNGARFFLPLRKELFSRILVDESRIKQFERDLYEELLPVARSNSFGGNWGYLTLEGRGLALFIRRPEGFVTREWVQAVPLSKEQRLSNKK